MAKEQNEQDISHLRQEAEAQLVQMQLKRNAADSREVLLHELQVHQIELEMQNETLRQAHIDMEESRDRYVDLYDFAPVGYLTISQDGTISGANLTAATLFKVARKELIRRRFDNFIMIDERDRWYLFYLGVVQHSEMQTIELRMLRGDGTDWYAQLDCVKEGAQHEHPMVRITLTDNTERKQVARTLAEAKVLAESEEKFRKITESAQDAIIIMGADRRISCWNASAEAIFGHTAKEALGQELHALIAPPEANAAFLGAAAHFQDSGEGPVIGKTIELIALRKGGDTFPVELSLSATRFDGQWNAIGIVRDITERKQAQIELSHANRALATLSEVNCNLVHAKNEDELLQAICQGIVKHGYRRAWVGYVQHDANESVKVMASAGHEGPPDGTQPDWAERSMTLADAAIHSGETQVCQDISCDLPAFPWREDTIRYGLMSCIVLPLKNTDETVFGILHVYAAEARAFIPAEVTLLEEMAADMAFGVQTLRTRHERDMAQEKNRQQLLQLQENLDDTVRTIATIVEMRDPYTAGHQARVADLATAIARELGLPDEQTHAIHLAGMVHDVGKIQVPSEILSKTGKISAIELLFIRSHAQAGYDILKNIHFPWPIAQMVLQHHERMDGSGYPQGLKGDAILPEARILAVADVIEAMSSHRPYRPELGVEAALEEIVLMRGTHYDPPAVDACVALFSVRGYILPK
ncbi:MAG: PAS domain S-box protein [Gallionella sp.]|nr:PAS domain S-box protein [Gallionella sp.]